MQIEGAVELTLEFEAEIVEEQTLLNGARYVSIEGQTIESQSGAGAGGWMLTLNWGRPKEADAPVSEGDLTLGRDSGSLFADLASGRTESVVDSFAGDEREVFDLAFVVVGGDGDLAGCTGVVTAHGEFTGADGTVRAELTIAAAPAGGSE